MEKKWSLRPATSEDFVTLLEIEMRVHVAPWNLTHFESELDKPYSQILILTDDDTDSLISGYIVFWSLMDACEILNVAVDLPFRGLGLGRHMVRQVIIVSIKKGLKKASLDVRKSNVPAVQLYQQLGFSICQICRHFYSNGEDSYQMTMELDGPKSDF